MAKTMELMPPSAKSSLGAFYQSEYLKTSTINNLTSHAERGEYANEPDNGTMPGYRQVRASGQPMQNNRKSDGGH